MVDRPPPSRFSVVERGGRLVVIDKETGQTPLSAAERMDIHDRKLGIEPMRPARAGTVASQPAAPGARPAPVRPAAAAADGKARMAAAIAGRDKRPWKAEPNDRPAPKPANTPAPARAAPSGAAGRKTIVTAKWWDSKGPRTIELGPKGQQTLSGGFVTLFFVMLAAAIVALFVAPVVLFIGGFLLFRFGGSILGPIGAGIVDKAIAEKG